MDTSKESVVSDANPLPTGIRIALWGLMILCVICYVVSFGLPAIEIGKDNIAFGLEAFCDGIFALLVGCPAVFANPMLWSGFIVLGWRKWRIALVLGILATILSISTLMMYAPGDDPRVSPDKIHYKITGLHPGYWWWLASFVLFTSACMLHVIATITQTLREHQGPDEAGCTARP